MKTKLTGILFLIAIITISCGNPSSENAISKDGYNSFDRQLWKVAVANAVEDAANPTDRCPLDPMAPNVPDYCYMKYFANLPEGVALSGYYRSDVGGHNILGHLNEHVVQGSPGGVVGGIVSKENAPPEDAPDQGCVISGEGETKLTKNSGDIWGISKDNVCISDDEFSFNEDQYQISGYNYGSEYGNQNKYCDGIMSKVVTFRTFTFLFEPTSCMKMCDKYPEVCK